MVSTFFDRDKFGDKLIEDYLNVFNNHSFMNELYGKISLHVILGQALCKIVCYRMGARTIDIRVHMFLIKPQGTGKGAGYGFVENICTALSLIFQSLTESTDAGLAGTVKINSDTKEKEIEEGVLQDADVVGMEEANVLVDLSNEYSRKNMMYIQITCNSLFDNSCRITRRLSGLLIDFKPHASFILMTYPPEHLAEKLLKTGFFDRMIVIFEDVTLADRLAVIKKMSENINVSTKESFAEQFNSVAERLKKVVEYFSKDNKPITICIPDDIDKIMLRVIDEFAMKILDASPKAREKLEHFVTRLYETLLKLAIHHALLDFRTDLKPSDIGYARLTYLPIWQNLIISIESLLIISPEERYRRIRSITTSINEYDLQIKSGKYVIEGVWVRRLTMVQNLKKMWDDCSTETADSILKKIEKQPPEMYDEFSKVSQYEKDKFFESKDFGGVMYLKKIRDLK